MFSFILNVPLLFSKLLKVIFTAFCCWLFLFMYEDWFCLVCVLIVDGELRLTDSDFLVKVVWVIVCVYKYFVCFSCWCVFVLSWLYVCGCGCKNNMTCVTVKLIDFCKYALVVAIVCSIKTKNNQQTELFKVRVNY